MVNPQLRITFSCYLNYRGSIYNLQYSWGYVPDIVAACGGTLFFYREGENSVCKDKICQTDSVFSRDLFVDIDMCASGIETYCFPMQKIIHAMSGRAVFIIK